MTPQEAMELTTFMASNNVAAFEFGILRVQFQQNVSVPELAKNALTKEDMERAEKEVAEKLMFGSSY